MLGLIIACAAGALVGSVSYRSYRPRIIQELMPSGRPTSSALVSPSESEKHRLLFELFRRVDGMSKPELSPVAAYIVKKARRAGTAEIYLKAEAIYSELEGRIRRNPSNEIMLNGTGLYRTALRLALLGIAEEEISELRSELHTWGFDELAPIAGPDLDLERRERSRASGIAVPIGFD